MLVDTQSSSVPILFIQTLFPAGQDLFVYEDPEGEHQEISWGNRIPRALECFQRGRGIGNSDIKGIAVMPFKADPQLCSDGLGGIMQQLFTERI